MRLQRIVNPTSNRVTGYKLWLSARETYSWATRPGDAWPGSALRSNRLFVEVDRNGICEFAVNGRDDEDVDGNELEAIVTDHLPADCRHLWPVWASQTVECITPA